MTKKPKIYNGKKKASLVNVVSLSDSCYVEKMITDSYFSSCKKLKSNWIKDLNIKQDTLTLIEEKVEKSPGLIGMGQNFLNTILRSKIDKRNLMKLKSLCKAKDTVNTTNLQIVKKIFTNSKSDRRLISKIYKELKKLSSKNPNNLIN